MMSTVGMLVSKIENVGRCFMKKQEVDVLKNKITIKEKFCKFVGFGIYKITLLVNNASLFCIKRSPSYRVIKEIMDENKENMEVGEKVKMASEKRYSDILKPYETIKELEDTLEIKDEVITEIEECITTCEYVILELYGLYNDEKFIDMGSVFEQYFTKKMKGEL